MAMPREVVNIAKTSSQNRVRSAVAKLQIARNSTTDVYTDTEYSVTMLAVLAEHRGFVIRKMPLKFGTGGLKMTIDEAIEERLKVIKVQEKLYKESYSDESKEIIKNATDNDRQFAEWLTELKDLREENKVLTSECDRLIKEKGELLSKISGGDVLKICQLENQLQVELDNNHCLEIELTEAKKLLKAVISDIYEVCSCNNRGCSICENKRETCDYDDRFTWRHTAAVLNLIGGKRNDTDM